mmetsp:Transcript_1824/g.4563  ORF Transcript_1824/g.4563 Transcript_1824/m.4563 type:complete len:291 (+) Transcript_1824:884-1756(+)
MRPSCEAASEFAEPERGGKAERVCCASGSARVFAEPARGGSGGAPVGCSSCSKAPCLPSASPSCSSSSEMRSSRPPEQTAWKSKGTYVTSASPMRVSSRARAWPSAISAPLLSLTSDTTDSSGPYSSSSQLTCAAQPATPALPSASTMERCGSATINCGGCHHVSGIEPRSCTCDCSLPMQSNTCSLSTRCATSPQPEPPSPRWWKRTPARRLERRAMVSTSKARPLSTPSWWCTNPSSSGSTHRSAHALMSGSTACRLKKKRGSARRQSGCARCTRVAMRCAVCVMSCS